MLTHPITLFQGDDLIIKGHYYETVSATKTDTSYEEERFPAVELDFTVRVNGKLTNFTESFSLIKRNGGEVVIREWSNWYLIVRIMSAMGYGFWPREDKFQELDSNTVIKDFVRNIMNSMSVKWCEIPEENE